MSQETNLTGGNDNKIRSAINYAEITGNCFQQDKAMFTYNYDDNSKISNITNTDGTKQSGSILQLTSTHFVYKLVGNYDFRGQIYVQVKLLFTFEKQKINNNY